jgi:TolA-binding protein
MPDNRSTLATRSYSLLKWLLALLIVLGIAYLLTHSEEAQDYGKQTLQKSEGFTSRVVNKTRQIYACITSDCSLRVGAAAAPHAASAGLAQSPPQPDAAPVSPDAMCIQCPTPPYFSSNAINSPIGPYSGNETVPSGGINDQARSPAAMPPAYPYYPGKAEATVMPEQATTETDQMPSVMLAPVAPSAAPAASIAAPIPPALATPAVSAPAASPASVSPPGKPLSAAVVSKAQIRARNWVTQKKYAYAVIAYKKHLAVYPNDYNAYGELGNVYLLEKDYPRAAESYYESAKRLMAAGQTEAISPLMPVITQYQPKLAAELRTHLPAQP